MPTKDCGQLLLLLLLESKPLVSNGRRTSLIVSLQIALSLSDQKRETNDAATAAIGELVVDRRSERFIT